MKKIIGTILLLPRSLYHWLWALWGALRYRFPSRKLVVIGITGTNGKSTTVALLHEIFMKAGGNVGSLSSLRFKINGTERKNELKMTMPGRGFVQAFLRECVDAGCRYVILEVTSEGIRQFRHRFINFDTAAITNLTPEHIESHGGFEQYRAMKQKLFESVAHARRKTISGKKIPKVIAVNLDDPEYKHFLSYGADRYIGYTLEERKDSMLYRVVAASGVSIGQRGISFVCEGQTFESSMPGLFNVSNMLAALSVATEYGISLASIKSALSSIAGVPGRLEYIREGQNFDVVVDYAHTPDALAKVYRAVEQRNPGTQMICVLGAAGGGRDVWKRPEFGKIASEWCAEIVLTNEDPYDENPEKIIEEIFSGCSQVPSSKILDRREAIRKALRDARAGDTVIITGKGAEPWMMGPRGTKEPWDDREVVREELRGTPKR